MSVHCPNCGREYADGTDPASCEDCPGVRLVDRTGIGSVAAVASAQAYESRQRVTSVLMVSGFVVGLIVATFVVWLAEKPDMLSPLVVGLTCAGLFWGAGTFVWERRTGAWQKRARSSQIGLAAGTYAMAALMLSWGLLYAGALTPGRHGKEQRGAWEVTVSEQLTRLGTCPGQPGGVGVLELTWRANEELLVGPTDIALETRRCVVDALAGLPEPPFSGPYNRVICPVKLAAGPEGIEVTGPVPKTSPCVWQGDRK